MRRYISVLILFFHSLAFGTVLESRGFLNRKCYAHLIKIEKNDGVCSISLFNHSTTRLSLNLTKCISDSKPGSWYYSHFKVHIGLKSPSTAEWLQGFEVRSEIIEAMLLREEGLSNPVDCE